MRQPIIDSKLSPTEALAQNPASPCPENILDSLGLMSVTYWSFDRREHVGQIVIAQTVMADVETFFQHAHEMKFPIAKIIPAADPKYNWDDEKMMADNNSSGFNHRNIAGTEEPSKHGCGWAFDINPVQNPYIRYENDKEIVQPPHAEWNPDIAGTLHADHPLVRMMEGLGWEWGGNWTRESGRIDYQHFEKQP